MSYPVLVTGATGGLGRNTVLRLAEGGRGLVLGGRRRSAVEALCAEVRDRFGVVATPFVADLSDLSEVRAAIERLGEARLHGIIANAGINSRSEDPSADGYEITFAVNVLAHQLIFCALAPHVVDGGRIVVVSSGVHMPDNQLARRAGIPVPRWVGTRALALPAEAAPELRIADFRQRYSTSKLGNVLQARGLQAQLRASGRRVDVFAIDPGLMVDTDLGREFPGPMRLAFRALGRLATPFVDNMRLSPTSAGHIASLVEGPEWRGRGFAYLDGDEVTSPSEDARDDRLMTELWRESLPLIGWEPQTGK